jgi:hypothetical protein
MNLGSDRWVLRRKGKSGSSFIELVGMGVIIVPIFLALIDLYFVIVGYWWTMGHCREAARAAAQGPPNAVLRDGPKQRAMQYLNVSSSDSNTTIHLTSCSVTEKIVSLPDPTYGGAVNGTVTVSVQVEVVPPFLLKMGVPGQKFVVNTNQSSPFTWVQPPKPEPN